MEVNFWLKLLEIFCLEFFNRYKKYCSALDKSDRLYYLYTNLKILNNLLQSMCDLLRLLYASLLLNMLLMLTLGFFILL